MADLKPSAAPSASVLDGTELFPITQAGASKAATPVQVRTFVYVLPNGTAAAPTLAFGPGSGVNWGQYWDSIHGGVVFEVNGESRFSIEIGSPRLRLGASVPICWTPQNDILPSQPDAGLARSAAAVLLATDGNNGLGALRSGREIEASTAGVVSPNLLLPTESRKALTNEGALAEAYNTLPSAAAGYEFVFIVQAAAGLRIVANTGDTIRMGGAVSASGGFIRSAVVGSTVTLVAINATEWLAVSALGTWTVDI